jgi:ribosomal-protein-alanine N-acetyltransferase
MPPTSAASSKPFRSFLSRLSAVREESRLCEDYHVFHWRVRPDGRSDHGPPAIVLRPAELADVDALDFLEKSVFGRLDARIWTKGEISAHVSSNLFCNFVAEAAISASRKRAIAGAVLCEPADDGASLYVCSLATRADFRRQGVATQLITAVFCLATDLGYSQVRLCLRQTNLAARLLYSKMGFVITGRTERYYVNRDGTTEASLHMMRAIKCPRWRSPVVEEAEYDSELQSALIGDACTARGLAPVTAGCTVRSSQ